MDGGDNFQDTLWQNLNFAREGTRPLDYLLIVLNAQKNHPERHITPAFQHHSTKARINRPHLQARAKPTSTSANHLAITALLSQKSLAAVNQHILNPSSPFQTLRRQFADLLSTLYNEIMSPVLRPVLDRATEALVNSPDIVVLGVIVLFLLLALQVLLWVRRMVAWFTALVLRLVFWAFVVAVVAVMWQRGPDQAVKDLAALVGMVSGYTALLYRYTRDVWLREYERYEAQQSGGAVAGQDYLQNRAAHGGGL